MRAHKTTPASAAQAAGQTADQTAPLTQPAESATPGTGRAAYENAGGANGNGASGSDNTSGDNGTGVGANGNRTARTLAALNANLSPERVWDYVRALAPSGPNWRRALATPVAPSAPSVAAWEKSAGPVAERLRTLPEAKAGSPAAQWQPAGRASGAADDATPPITPDARPESSAPLSVEDLEPMPPAPVLARLRVALADRDAILADDFRFGAVCAALTSKHLEGFWAADDLYDDDEDEALALAGDEEDPADLLGEDDATAVDPGDCAALARHLDACPFCRARAHLALTRATAPDRRTLVEEAERLILEPAVLWRQMQRAWQTQAGAAGAADAVATAGTLVVLDGPSGAPLDLADSLADIQGPGWHRDHIQFTATNLPERYQRYRLAVVTPEAMPAASAAAEPLPPRAAALASGVHAPGSLPTVAVPVFTGALVKGGGGTGVSWSSPALGTGALTGDEWFIVSLY